MKTYCWTGFLTILTMVFMGCRETAVSIPDSDAALSRLSFVMIHLEAGYQSRLDNNLPPGIVLPDEYRKRELGWQEYLWPTVISLVQKADQYGFKLTLAFNPQWGQFILLDPAKVSLVRQWQAAGHEVGFHHHARNHPDWNGYSNANTGANPVPLLGTVNEGFSYVRNLGSPENVISSTMGGIPDDHPSLMTPPAGTDFVFGNGNYFDSYPACLPSGQQLRSLVPVRSYLQNFDRYKVDLTIRVLSTVMECLTVDEAIPILEDQYVKMSPTEVFGTVFHEFDYFVRRDSYIKWFDFLKNNGARVRTMRDVAAEYFKH